MSRRIGPRAICGIALVQYQHYNAILDFLYIWIDQWHTRGLERMQIINLQAHAMLAVGNG
jgi:hypothetical protein